MPTAFTGQIEVVTSPAPTEVEAALAELLVDAVAHGASVSFSGSIAPEEARSWWATTLAGFGDRDVLLVARDADGIVGTVNVRGCWQANQRFRGEITKLLVHSRARRRGIGRALMQAIESHALAIGLTLLVLDTNAHSEADRLYQSLGWTRVGEIPGYSLRYDGQRWPTAIFYKSLTHGG